MWERFVIPSRKQIESRLFDFPLPFKPVMVLNNGLNLLILKQDFNAKTMPKMARLQDLHHIPQTQSRKGHFASRCNPAWKFLATGMPYFQFSLYVLIIHNFIKMAFFNSLSHIHVQMFHNRFDSDLQIFACSRW